MAKDLNLRRVGCNLERTRLGFDIDCVGASGLQLSLLKLLLQQQPLRLLSRSLDDPSVLVKSLNLFPCLTLPFSVFDLQQLTLSSFSLLSLEL